MLVNTLKKMIKYNVIIKNRIPNAWFYNFEIDKILTEKNLEFGY